MTPNDPASEDSWLDDLAGEMDRQRAEDEALIIAWLAWDEDAEELDRLMRE